MSCITTFLACITLALFFICGEVLHKKVCQSGRSLHRLGHENARVHCGEQIFVCGGFFNAVKYKGPSTMYFLGPRVGKFHSYNLKLGDSTDWEQHLARTRRVDESTLTFFRLGY